MKRLMIDGAYGTLPVDSIILGTDHFGTRISQDRAIELLDCYWDEGGTTLDTARIYGHRKDDLSIPPCTENILGQWMAEHGNRSQMTLITKGGHPTLGRISESRINRAQLTLDLENSLRNLKTDYIDIFFCIEMTPLFR